MAFVASIIFKIPCDENNRGKGKFKKHEFKNTKWKSRPGAISSSVGASPPCSLDRTLLLREAEGQPEQQETKHAPAPRGICADWVMCPNLCKPGSQTAGHFRRGQHPRTMGRMATDSCPVHLDQSPQSPAPTPQSLCEPPLQPRRVTAPFISFQAGPCVSVSPK